MACLPWASFLFVPSLAFWVSGVGQLSPEVGEGEGGGLRYNPVSDDAEASGASEVHPGSHPISHSAKRGFSWRLLDKVVNKASSRSSCSSPALSAISPRSEASQSAAKGSLHQLAIHSSRASWGEVGALGEDGPPELPVSGSRREGW